MMMTMMIIIVISFVIVRVIDSAINTIIVNNHISVSSVSVIIMFMNSIDIIDIAYCLLPTLLLSMNQFALTQPVVCCFLACKHTCTLPQLSSISSASQ